MQHRARKRFGQHFLTDADVIGDMVAAIAPAPGETLVEIGPGRAALTDALAASAGQLHLVEFDRDLVGWLQRRYAGRDDIHVHEADALQLDFAMLGARLRLVGNLPYNISTPLLFHVLEFSAAMVDAHFMLQKEVVRRICASPGSKAWGRLSVMLGCHLEAVPLFDVAPSAFSPPPKVVSSVLRLRPLGERATAIADPALFSAIVGQAFTRRRKTLRNALQGLATPADLDAAGLDDGRRPEQLSVAEWAALANYLHGSEPAG